MTRRARHILTLALLAALASGRAAAQQDGATVIQPVGDAVRAVDPGDVATVLFRIDHQGLDSLASQLEIGLPDRWMLLSQPGPATIAPGSSTNRLIALHVPDRALPDMHRVSVALIDSGGDTLSTAGVTFRVKTRRAIRASVLSGPPVTASSAPFQVRFAVVNDGNSHETVLLAASSSLGQLVRLGEDRVRLAPYSATEVVVDVEPEGFGPGRQPHVIRLVAESSGGDGPPITSHAQLRTDQVPEGWDRTEDEAGIPVEVGLIASGSPDDVGRQLAVSMPEARLGGGTVQIGLRGPYMRQAGPFTQQDFYFASYADASTTVGLGDQGFRQSPLTEYGTNGFGARVSRDFGRARLSTYAMRTRHRFPERSQVGLSTSVDVLPSVSLTLNSLAKRDFVDAGLITAGSEWRFGMRSFVQAEYGVGRYGGSSGSGVRLQLTHADGSRHVDLRYQNSTESFPGSARGTRIVSATASQDLGPFATLSASFGRNRRAVDFGRTAPTVNGHGRIGGTVRLKPLAGVRFTGSLAANHRYREEARSDLTRSERFVSASIGANRARTTARLSLEHGRTTLAHGVRPFSRSDLNIFARWNNITISGTWVWESGPRYHYPRDTGRHQWSLSADARVARGIRAGIDVFANHFRDPSLARSRYLNTSVAFDLPYGHRLTARTRLVQTIMPHARSTDLVAGFAYSIPVTVPTRRAGSGFSGRVLLASSGKPVHNALVSAGDRAVLTDRDGRFAFGRLPIDGMITVDPGAQGAGLVVMNPDALRIEPERSDTSPIDIVLAPGAAIEGRFEVVREGRSMETLTANVPASPGSGVVVVATDGFSERYAMTRGDGRFVLEGLAPGQWTVRVVRESLPVEFVPSGDSIVAHLVAGQRLAHAVPVRARTRAIQMMGESVLALGDSVRSTDPPAAPVRMDTEEDAPGAALASVLPEIDRPANAAELEAPDTEIPAEITGSAIAADDRRAGRPVETTIDVSTLLLPFLRSHSRTAGAHAAARSHSRYTGGPSRPRSGLPDWLWLAVLLLIVAESERRLRHAVQARRRPARRARSRFALRARPWPLPSGHDRPATGSRTGSRARRDRETPS